LSDTIAVVFDFDDTLVPDSTSLLLEQHGIDPKKFWTEELEDAVRRGYEPTLGFLHLFLANVGDGKPLGRLTNERLREFGSTLDSRLHPGLPKVFDDLRQIGRDIGRVCVEFYIVSGGLQSVIEGTAIFKKGYFETVYGCLLEEDGDPPAVAHVKRAISFTEKTRYLFEINKGISQADSNRNPYLVNRDVPDSKRHVAFRNMIYVGDGLTDIPCFSLLKKYDAPRFGVFDPSNEGKAKRAFLEFLQPGRVVGMHAPKYGPTMNSDHSFGCRRCSVHTIDVRAGNRLVPALCYHH
jgi:phosphoglycolate phosphatase-like HAD superfamily hydrolase